MMEMELIVHVRIYQNNNGTWTQIGSDIDGEGAQDFSGGSVSLSSDGSIVAIGARLNDDNGINSGHVRIYQTLSNVSIEENTIAVTSYTVTDADTGDTVSWALTGDDASLFDISDSGELAFKSAPDYETWIFVSSNAYSLTVTATDAGGLQIQLKNQCIQFTR